MLYISNYFVFRTEYQDVPKTDNNMHADMEDEILNRCDSTNSILDNIDSVLEEKLLNEDDDMKFQSSQMNCKDGVTKLDSKNDEVQNKPKQNGFTEDDLNETDLNKIIFKLPANKMHDSDVCPKENEFVNSFDDLGEDSKVAKKDERMKNSENETEFLQVAGEEYQILETVGDAKDCKENEVNERNGDHLAIKTSSEKESDVPQGDQDTPMESSEQKETITEDEQSEKKAESEVNEVDKELPIGQDDKKSGTPEDTTTEDKASSKPALEKSEASNDSTKNQIDDSEDLLDISIIRDMEEDNAQAAYNEEHPEESEDDHASDKTENVEDDGSDERENEGATDKIDNMEVDLEDVETTDKAEDENEDQSKCEVDIEETNLNCDVVVGKEGIVSDTDNASNDASATTVVTVENGDKVQDAVSDKEGGAPVDVAEKFDEVKLDEVTGVMVGCENKAPEQGGVEDMDVKDDGKL